MKNDEAPSDIPVDQYEVAIFTNRFSSFKLVESDIPHLEVETNQAVGTCDVILIVRNITMSSLSYLLRELN